MLIPLVCSRFEFCGKSQGILTASKAAALASKYIQKCGKSMLLNYSWTMPKMVKIAEKSCLGINLCYSHHEAKKRKSTLDFRRAVRDCLVKGTVTLYTVKPEIFSFEKEEFMQLIQHMNMCLRGDMLPLDASVANGAIRHFLKAVNLVPPSQ
ncbi:uncharacterized protein [Dermacentor andersoni]|uniref:uncharacterized protein n=1 Tax=Dermacentor andersoni TaxID=34620 RepID=UPI0024164876|nr:uncharacterized protein LOC126540871 isoform X1 [Dermacentor andersoni]